MNENIVTVFCGTGFLGRRVVWRRWCLLSGVTRTGFAETQ